MNDLGLTLAWLAVQVALLLLPALALHALASRRGPAAGAWVASLSLGLVVALNVAAFVPGIGRSMGSREVEAMAPPAVTSGTRHDRSPPIRPTGRATDRTSVSRTGLGARVAAVGLGPARARGG